MRTSLMLSTAAAALVLSMASIDLVAQRDGGPGRGGPGRGGPGPGVDAPAATVDAPRGGPRRMGPVRRGGPAPAAEFGRNLNLTDEQRAKVQSLTRAARDQAAPLTDELVLARRTLQREVFADKADAKKVAELSARVATLRKQVDDIHLNTTTSIAAILTPEQRQQMRIGEGPGRGGRPGPR